jgi:hypothetical protein
LDGALAPILKEKDSAIATYVRLMKLTGHGIKRCQWGAMLGLAALILSGCGLIPQGTEPASGELAGAPSTNTPRPSLEATPIPTPLPSPGETPSPTTLTGLEETPTPTSAPSPAQTPELAGFESHSAQFLVDHLGLDYFRQHFTLLHEELVESGVVKASYDYAFPPYVEHYQMTLQLDVDRAQLRDDEVSRVLLEPQQFAIEPAQAIELAQQNGLSPSEPYEVNLVLDRTTKNRFAWEVISSAVSPGSELPEPIIRVVLDVERGNVYAVERFGPMTSQ